MATMFTITPETNSRDKPRSRSPLTLSALYLPTLYPYICLITPPRPKRSIGLNGYSWGGGGKCTGIHMVRLGSVAFRQRDRVGRRARRLASSVYGAEFNS